MDEGRRFTYRYVAPGIEFPSPPTIDITVIRAPGMSPLDLILALENGVRQISVALQAESHNDDNR